MQIQDLADNLGLEADEFYEIFELYMQTTSSDLEELKAKLDAGNAEDIHKKAHSIKGASGNLGLNELYELATEIDDRARINSLDGMEDMVRAFQEKYEKVVEEIGKGR